MASKVISIEIGYSLTKFCEMDYRVKAPKVYKSFTMRTPENVYNDGVLAPSDQFISQIKEELGKNGMHTRQAVIAVTSTKIANREVNIPMVKENRIGAMIEANASDYFPVDLTEYELAYNVLGTAKDGSGYRVLVLAAPKSLLKTYYDFAAKCGLSLAALDYSGNSIYQIVKDTCKEGAQMVIKIDEHSSIATAISEKIILMQRNISYGVNDAIESMIENFPDKIASYEDALSMLRRKTWIYSTFQYEEDLGGAEKEDLSQMAISEENYKKGKIAVTDTLKQLVNGIARVLDFYNSNNSALPINKVYITGIGGDFSGLSKLLSNELGIKVSVLDKVENIHFDKAFKSKEVSFGEYLACIGAAIAPLGFMPDTKKAKTEEKGKSAKKSGSILPGLLILLVCLLAAGFVCAYSYMKYTEAVAERAVKELELQSLAQVEADYIAYLNQKIVYDEVKKMYGFTENQNEQIVGFIEEMETALPSSAQVLSMTSSTTDVVLNMEVDSKEALANVVDALGKFKCFSKVSLASATEEVTEEGMKKVSFSVTCTYKTNEELAAEAAKQEDKKQ